MDQIFRIWFWFFLKMSIFTGQYLALHLCVISYLFDGWQLILLQTVPKLPIWGGLKQKLQNRQTLLFSSWSFASWSWLFAFSKSFFKSLIFFWASINSVKAVLISLHSKGSTEFAKSNNSWVYCWNFSFSLGLDSS